MKLGKHSMRRLIFCVLAGVVAVGAITQKGYAQGGGPPGGSVEALAIDPSTPATLFAGTHGGGVFKSTNRGTSWTAARAAVVTTKHTV